MNIMLSINTQRPQKLTEFQLQWLHSFKLLRLGLISAPLPARLDIQESTQTLPL